MERNGAKLNRTILLFRSLRHEVRNIIFWLAFARYKFRRDTHKDLSAASWVFDDLVVLVINLASRPDRMEQVRTQLNSIGVDRFFVVPAVDGRQTYPELSTLSGKRGCAESHLLALSLAQEYEVPALILEDDVLFIEPESLLRRVVDSFLSADAIDLLLLDWSTPRHRAIDSHLALVTDSVLTSAYVVKPRAIPQLRKDFVRSGKKLQKKQNLPIDHAWWRAQRWKLVAAASLQRMCRQSSGFSNIEAKHVAN